MDTHTLTAFVAVAKSGSFSLAAHTLFLTQSAISKRIAQLEEQLSTRLFDRIGRTVTLTEAGQALLPRAQFILLELDDAKRALSNLTGEVSGTLSLAASHHISLHRLPSILRSFSQQFPEVELDLRFAESEIAYDGILKGELELALITLAPQPNAHILSQQIWQDQLCFVVAKSHPLAEKKQLELEELANFKAILPDNNTFTYSIAQQLFDSKSLQLNVAMSTNYLDTIRMMVSIGLGWSLLPNTMLGSDLTVLNVNAQPVSRPLGYIYHRNRTLSNAASNFIQLLQHESM